MEFASIEVSACCRSFKNLPKSFDDGDAKQAAQFCHQLREWLAGQGINDRRILVQRWEYLNAPSKEDELSGKYERKTWAIQWDGQDSAQCEWTREAYKSGVDVELLAILIGRTVEELNNLHGNDGNAPGVGKVIAAKVDMSKVSPHMRNVLHQLANRGGSSS